MKKENKQNEEIQSRREFFKEAAKKTLPVIGAIVLTSSPIIASAKESHDCSGGCYMGCYNGCLSTCKGICSGECHYGCRKSCQGSCSGTCSGSCSGACARSSSY